VVSWSIADQVLIAKKVSFFTFTRSYLQNPWAFQSAVRGRTSF